MIRIREMQERDAESAGALEELVFSMPWKREDFVEMVRAPYAHYYVALTNNETRVIGICGLRELSGDAEITNVAVHPDFRRQHLATRLLTEALKRGEASGIYDTTLEVRESNEAARKLYEGFGFRVEGRRPGFYEKPAEDAIIYWRRAVRPEKAAAERKFTAPQGGEVI